MNSVERMTSLEARIALLEARIAQLESRPLTPWPGPSPIIPMTPGPSPVIPMMPQIPQYPVYPWSISDCNCPPNIACLNGACPRLPRSTC